jgi:hypothetical protein
MKKLLISVEQDVEVADYSGQQSSADHFDCTPQSIYIVCCKSGQIDIQSTFIPHPITLSKAEVIFLAFPQMPWGMIVRHQESSHYYIMRLTLEKLHALISASFSQEGLDKQKAINYQDLMKVLPVSPATVNIFDL